MTIAASEKDIVVGRTSNTLFVDDQWGEDTPKGLREYSTRPFKTMQAAIDAAVAGDTVIVFPGNYSELHTVGPISKGITCKDGVSIIGVNKRTCKYQPLNMTDQQYAVTMAEFMAFENMTVIVEQNPAPAVAPNWVGGCLFPPLTNTNATSTIRNADFLRLGTSVTYGVVDAGVGLSSLQHITLDSSVCMGGGGLVSGYVKSGIGTSRVRNSYLYGFIGANLVSGTLHIRGGQVFGYLGVLTGAGTSLKTDRSATWNSIVANGTHELQGTGFKADPTVTVQATASIIISNISDTLLLTLPSIAAHTNPVRIDFTTCIDKPGGATRAATFKLFRNGVEINVTDRFQQQVRQAWNEWTVHMHWVDLAPGNAPVYTILAIADGTDMEAVFNRRATATI